MSPEDFLGYLLSRLGGKARVITDAALNPLGMTARTLGVLALIEHRPGLRQVLVSEQMGFDRTSTSQLIDELAEAGLVERAIDDRDRRSHALRLTGKGRKKLATATAAGKRAEAEFARALNQSQVAELKQLLTKLLETS